MTQESSRRDGSRFAWFGVLLVLCFCTNVSAPRHGTVSAASITTPIVVAQLPDCLDCGEDMCESGWHDAWDTTPAFQRWHRNGGAHLDDACREYTCDVRHGPACEPLPDGLVALTTADIETLRATVVAGDAQLIAVLVKAHPKEFTVNVERSAIQLLGCTGMVTMHMPIPAEMLGALEAHHLASPQ